MPISTSAAPCRRRLAALYSLLSTRYGHFKLNQIKCALAIISIPFRSIVSVALFQTADYLGYDGLALSLHSRALDTRRSSAGDGSTSAQSWTITVATSSRGSYAPT